MIFGNLLFNNLRDNAEKTALVEDGHAFTYNEFCILVNSLSYYLEIKGVKKGDRVSLYLPNSVELAAAFFSVTNLGAICVPVNHKYKSNELKNYVVQSGSEFLLTSEKLHKEVVKNNLGIKIIIVKGKNADWSVSEVGNDTERKNIKHSELDNAIYLFSTGSTGVPKCVARHHQNLVALADNHTGTVGWDNTDRILFVIPLSHTYAFGNYISSVKVGATIYLLEDFNRKNVCEMLVNEKITVFPAVPFMLDMLSSYKSAENKDYSSLKHVISAGAPLVEKVAERFNDVFSVYPRQLYGSSETGVISINMADDIRLRNQSVGRPVNSVVVNIVDDKGEICGDNELGELIVSSPSMTPGYLNLVEETKKVFKKGFYYTGDLGLIDNEGYIYIKGRKKLFINISGQKIDPVEVENTLLSHSAILEVAVTGRKLESGNEVVAAYIVSGTKLNSSDIIEFCRGKISDIKIPSSINFVKSLPKSPTGKILR
ncbi:MAG: class I adenylate-forming enzyme family protein, partial [Thermodesulfobacteriota bacterium]